MLAKTYSASHVGIEGLVVEVQAAQTQNNPGLQITGLAGDVIKESREKILACLDQFGFETPTAKIVINLSPAELKKQGSHFDLALSVAILATERKIEPSSIGERAFLGELALDGRIERVRGSIALLQVLEKSPLIKEIIIPPDNALEASLLQSKKARMATHFGQLLDYLGGKIALPTPQEKLPDLSEIPGTNLDEVMGQSHAKRALQIAVAGRHHLLMIGPPGVGKSLIAQCAPSLLPPLSSSEFLEVLKNYSYHKLPQNLSRRRPFRSPHHSISQSALLGGGNATVVPGEVSLAHYGMLFLDEFPEFRRDAIEGLREPLQSGEIHLHRVGTPVLLPARFTLIAAMNPCPCGLFTSTSQPCTCTSDAIKNYRKRISGPIFDRIDLYVSMESASHSSATHPDFAAENLKAGIAQAIQMQQERYLNPAIRNGDVTASLKSKPFELLQENWFVGRCRRENISYRSQHKIVRLARTLADLEGCPTISQNHLREAWHLRCPDLPKQLYGK